MLVMIVTMEVVVLKVIGKLGDCLDSVVVGQRVRGLPEGTVSPLHGYHGWHHWENPGDGILIWSMDLWNCDITCGMACQCQWQWVACIWWPPRCLSPPSWHCWRQPPGAPPPPCWSAPGWSSRRPPCFPMKQWWKYWAWEAAEQKNEPHCSRSSSSRNHWVPQSPKKHQKKVMILKHNHPKSNKKLLHNILKHNHRSVSQVA